MKILIIKLGALGDIIMSTPIINRLQKHYIDDDLWLLTTPPYESLFDAWEGLNVKAFNRYGATNILKTVKWVRDNKFSRLYDLQSNDRTTILSALSGIPVRAGNHPRFPYHLHPKIKYAGECHSFDRLNQILESANINAAPPTPYLPVTELIVNKVSKWLTLNHTNNKTLALIHAGSSHLHPQKRWPYFSELAKILVENNINLVWIGSDDDAALNKKLSRGYGIDATNQFTLPELVELGKHASFAITNDSAPMHILSCSSIPVYSLFGPTNPRRTHALGQKKHIINASGNIALNDRDFIPTAINKITCELVIKRLKDDGFLT